jgi:hypothetical protein
MRQASLFIGLVAIVFALPLPVSPQGTALLSGQIAHDRVNQLTSQMTWYTSLYQAEETAMHQNKMILWVHMLGDIKGAT